MDKEREAREWWASLDGAVRRVRGFTCAPENPGYWWCPEVRSSLHEGTHLFEREDEALAAAIRGLTGTILEANAARERLRHRLVAVIRWQQARATAEERENVR